MKQRTPFIYVQVVIELFAGVVGLENDGDEGIPKVILVAHKVRVDPYGYSSAEVDSSNLVLHPFL